MSASSLHRIRPAAGCGPVLHRLRGSLIGALLVAGTACYESPTEPDRVAAPALSVIEVDDGASHFRDVASNLPASGNVWTSLAQSFTAEDPHVLFAFKLKSDGFPHVGATVIYNLYDGENSYTTLLASRSTALPALPPGVIDFGFIEVDFSAVTLVPGQQYTVEITVPAGDLPAAGATTGFGVRTSLSDPYAGGRFYFPTGYNNAFFADHDMLFRVTPTTSSVTYDCAAQAQIPQAECAALVALYEATGGPAWTSSTDWLQTTTPCTWFGVLCAGGSVIRLTLGSNGLTGSIPADVGDLTNLQLLDFNQNQLGGSVPPELGDLSNLQLLLLLGNQLTGPIPPELSGLSSLQFFSLGGNQLTGEVPAWLGGLPNLRGIDLGPNRLTGPIPVELANLTNLGTLDLEENQLSGPIPPELGTLSNLQTLSLPGNSLTGPIPVALGNLARLRFLILDRNQLGGSIPSALGGLSNLTRLSLPQNQLTGEIPAELGNLSRLTFLRLEGNQLSGPVPGGLGQLALAWFDISSNGLQGRVPLAVAELGGSGTPGICRFVPGNPGLYIPDVSTYRAADLDHDGRICGLSLTADPMVVLNDLQALLDALRAAGQLSTLDFRLFNLTLDFVRRSSGHGPLWTTAAKRRLEVFQWHANLLARIGRLQAAEASVLVESAGILIELL